ncbi:MAG: PilT/PilU family type 4a pilus ATPase [Bradymonadales bacterium]|nr:PilT/PilU family type 4a pilus ATPase [Bradymonadales bacterium]
MKLFKGKKAQLIERLANQQWESTRERDRLLEMLQQTPGLALEEVSWMLFDRDAMVRSAGQRLVRQLKPPDLLGYFVERWNEMAPVLRRSLAHSWHRLAASGWERSLENLLASKKEVERAVADEIIQASPVTGPLQQLLLRQLQGANEFARHRALLRLLESPGDLPASTFEPFLDYPDEQVRRLVIKILAATSERRYLDLFAARLETEHIEIQQDLIAVMAQYAEQGHDITSLVLPLLSSGDANLRQAAIKVLGRISNPSRILREFIDYSRHFPGWIRQRALESMQAFGDLLISSIAELLRDSDPLVRASATQLAATVHRDERLEKVVLPLLGDPDWWVRINAAETLGAIGSALCVPKLMELLDDPEIAWTAIESLATIGDKSCLPKLVGLLGSPAEEMRVEVVKALARFRSAKAIPVLVKVADSDSSMEVRIAAEDSLGRLAESLNLSKEEIQKSYRPLGRGQIAAPAQEQLPIIGLLTDARKAQASDVHLSVDQVPLIRIRGELTAMTGHPPLTSDQTLAWLSPLLNPDQERHLIRTRSIDLCYEILDQGRYRGSIFIDRRGLNGSFRVIPSTIPTLDELGMPPHIAQVAHWHQGMVLIVGPAGSGKTTTLAALVNLINEQRSAHIVTLEDPIEYIFHYKRSLVDQRQIGLHSTSYQRALRAALREDPDVIILGEMRDTPTMRLALEAAETGHLVIGTLNGTNAIRAVDRVIDSFPPDEQSQTRIILADTLKLILAQALLPRADGQGRVAVYEVLMGGYTVSAVIRENRLVLMNTLMQTGRRLGMRTYDDNLLALVDQGLVDPQVAYLRARRKDRFESMVSPEFLQGVLA